MRVDTPQHTSETKALFVILSTKLASSNTSKSWFIVHYSSEYAAFAMAIGDNNSAYWGKTE